MTHIVNEAIPLSSSGKWKEAIMDVPHSFGHTWESCYAMSQTSGYPTYLYLFKQNDVKIICPIAERKYNGYIDIVTPYGFSGFSGTGEPVDFKHYWDAFVQSRGYVCGYIGLNPLFEKYVCLDMDEAAGHNSVFIIDLRLSQEELFKKLSSNRKRELKNFTAIQQNITRNKEDCKVFFIANYHSFFAQRQHSSAYDLSPATLDFLISSESVFLNGIYDNNELKAVAMHAYTPDCGEYLFYISPEKKYTTYLIWDAVDYLKSKSIPFLNLGGGVSNADSIAGFKQRFGGLEFPLRSLRQVYNKDVYDELSRQSPAGDARSGYFPAYRAGQMQQN